MDQITLEHPDYAARKKSWRQYGDLYTGGEIFRLNAAEYLTARQREPADVYQERLNRVFCENYVGSIIDWYAATLFRREPVIALENAPPGCSTFYHCFLDDADQRGSSLTDFFRRQLTSALIYGASYTLVDFPRTGMAPANRAEEDRMGVSRAYVVGYTPLDLINWSRDERGNFDWVVLRTTSLNKRDVAAAQWTEETQWAYYDRSSFQRYRQVKQGDKVEPIELVDQGPHGLAAQNVVPVFEMQVSDGLWLMNKAARLQLEHFNQSNALSWALTTGLFAVPVVFSERDMSQRIGSSYFIQLGSEDRFAWSEPEGKVYQLAANNLARVKDEIYRVSYLMGQAGGPPGSAQQQSGLSKQRDYAVTQEVLRAYGDLVKAAMKRILRAIESARDDGMTIDVSGLDEFDIGDFTSDLEDAGRLLSLGIPSETLKREVFKKVALKYLCDVRNEVKDAIAQEISRVI
ncbi:MAG: hypothetical protein FJW40_08720 [Acidobacteria bacterium]|nr:hypothetical protein [Acidobacteriota bacterium]